MQYVAFSLSFAFCYQVHGFPQMRTPCLFLKVGHGFAVVDTVKALQSFETSYFRNWLRTEAGLVV